MRRTRLLLSLATSTTLAALVAPSGDAVARTAHTVGQPRLLVSGLQGTSGSAVGPDRALYVPEAVTGTVTRVDPTTGATSVFATGLPTRVLPLGGATDVAFLHRTAYVLVTLVSPDVGGSHADGIYRVDSRHHVTLVADIGAWSMAHPPATDFAVPTGVQFAMEPYRHGFLVTDGHHNRVLHVSLGGRISEVLTLPNVVPTGLDRRGSRIYLAQAGPVPHLPSDGRIVRFRIGSSHLQQVASGAPLLVDVEFGHGRLYALAQGHFTPGGEAGSPADPDTGALLRVSRDQTMTPIARLDRPTSLEIICHTAYVVTLAGEIWAVPGL
jgi:hypothetical protein